LNGTHPINSPLIKATIQKVIGTEIQVFLYYPEFNKPVLFHLYNYASDQQLEAVIMQDKKKNNYSFLFAKAQYNSKAVLNH
jgi:succinylglutamate desuccinylase